MADESRYLKYLDGLDLTRDEKIELINNLIGFFEPMLKEKYAVKCNAKSSSKSNHLLQGIKQASG